MVAAEVVVPFEFAVIVTHIPITACLHAMNQAAVMEHRQIEAATIPRNQLGSIFIDTVEKSPDEFRFGIGRAAQRPYAKIVFVAQGA